MADVNGLVELDDAYLSFELDKEDAILAYKDFKHGKIFAPRIFRNKQHFQQVTKVYLPLWLFEGEASFSTRYDGRKVRKYTEQAGEGEQEITETEIFDVKREGTVTIDGVLIPATSTVPEVNFVRMMPFDLESAVFEAPSNDKVLPADRALEVARAEAEEKMTELAAAHVAGTVKGFNESSEKETSITSKVTSARKVYVPVWMLDTDWKGKNYRFTMNGRSGKVAAELPVALSSVIASLVALFVLTFVLVTYSDATSWHIVGLPAKIIMYLVLPSFVAGTLTFSYYNQIAMVNKPKPPTPNKPGFALELTSSSDEVVDVQTESRKKRGHLGGGMF